MLPAKRLGDASEGKIWFERNRYPGVLLHYPKAFGGSGAKGSDKEHTLTLMYHDGVQVQSYVEEFGTIFYGEEVAKHVVWYYVTLASMLRALQFAIGGGYKTILTSYMIVFNKLSAGPPAFFETAEEMAIWRSVVEAYAIYVANGGQVIDAVVSRAQYEDE